MHISFIFSVIVFTLIVLIYILLGTWDFFEPSVPAQKNLVLFYFTLFPDDIQVFFAVV